MTGMYVVVRCRGDIRTKVPREENAQESPRTNTRLRDLPHISPLGISPGRDPSGVALDAALEA